MYITLIVKILVDTTKKKKKTETWIRLGLGSVIFYHLRFLECI